MASIGHEVIAFDINKDKIAKLNSGNLPFFEPELEELVKAGIKSGNLKFTSDLEQVALFADVHFLCVGTPQADDSGTADVRQIQDAIKAITPLLKSGASIVGKSTVPVGTAAWIEEYLVNNSSENLSLIWNPEFLREGFAVRDTLHPDRIVLGVSNSRDAEMVAEVYSPIISTGTPLIVTDFETAELVKVAANAFLATKISFINAFSDLCDSVGADISTLADAIGLDERIGRKFLNAGIGFGGGCLPKDIRALQARAKELGIGKQFEFLVEVDRINQSRLKKVLDLATEILGEISGKKITILGASFKPNSDDVRDSPSVNIAKEMQRVGAHVIIHDPMAISALNKKDPSLVTEENLYEAVANSDLILHLTEWSEYRNIDVAEISSKVRAKNIIDGRNVLDKQTWANAGWHVTYLGKPGS
ncbi:MAG: hypothetical protein RIS61_834 [Actinomycetota bacterium]|jgi:UDPglucose 6-dehydrogenase